MTPADFEALHPELFAIVRELRAAAIDLARHLDGGVAEIKRATESVRFRCLHDFDGNLLAGKPPEDLVLGPIPPDPSEDPAPAPAPYRGKAR